MREIKKFVLEQVLLSKKKINGYYYIDIASEEDFVFHDGFCILDDETFIKLNGFYNSYYLLESPTEKWNLDDENIYFGPISSYSKYFEICTEIGDLLFLDHFIISEDFSLVIYVSADLFISFSSKSINLSEILRQTKEDNRKEYFKYSSSPKDDDLIKHYWGSDWYKDVI